MNLQALIPPQAATKKWSRWKTALGINILSDDSGVAPGRYLNRAEAIKAFEKCSLEQPVDHDSQLRFLFWKYCKALERRTLLIVFGDLSPSSIGNIPQTLEMVLLNNPKLDKSGLWDAVMKFVPEDKRKENPYGSHK